MRPFALKLAQVLLFLLFGAGAIALLRDTAAQGQDFQVFWQSGRHLLQLQPLYDIARDGAMAYKYPPWIAPFFIPLSLLPLIVAKWVWALTELVSLLSIVFWLKIKKCSLTAIALTTLLFWGVFAVHFLDGQITLVMLAVSLWSWEKRILPPVVFALSTKIFSGISLVGFPRPRAKQILSTVAFLVAFSLPAIWSAQNSNPVKFIQSWKDAATSGGALFENDKTRGRDNQGLPAVILRALEIPSRDTQADWIAALVCALALGSYWIYRSNQIKGFGALEKWLGWLALGCVIHPLAWFHFFVLAFPLAVFTLDRAFRLKDRGLIGGTLLAIVMMTALTSKTSHLLGPDLEFLSVKSFGVLFLMDMLLILERRRLAVGQCRELKLVHSV